MFCESVTVQYMCCGAVLVQCCRSMRESEVSNYFNDLLAGLLVVSNDSLSLKDQSILCIPFSN